ncbi:glycosyltransferase family 2 protein [Metabacillus fastidiosus]|uniref:glycosyltransferase n=1 Tax=Metabacillus fastidiosus TaxID=1458 RepID=UPI002E1EA92B|nr:glycosyltransferase family 2 protein [Metabacillus fastidiosus]
MLLFIISCLIIFTIWTVINSMFLPHLPNKTESQENTLVSILVPMRNEERNAAALVQCLKLLTFSNIEYILLDDQSTDRTSAILHKVVHNDRRFKIINGRNLQDGWSGKVFACHQLQKVAKGDYLLFIDADVRLSSDCIQKSLALLKKHKAKLLTGFPAFQVPPLLSKILVPMQHFAIMFHLPIFIANKTTIQAATAAHGAFMLFERSAYLQINGHESVKSSLVEDVHIARKMKESGFHVLLANITGEVSCLMYETNKEVWEGFLKNIYIGLNRSILFVFILTGFYSLFYILPFIWLLYGFLTLQPVYCIPYIIIFLQRFIIDLLTKQYWFLSFLMPISAIFFIAIMHASMWTSLRQKSYKWKGRYYI